MVSASSLESISVAPAAVRAVVNRGQSISPHVIKSAAVYAATRPAIRQPARSRADRFDPCKSISRLTLEQSNHSIADVAAVQASPVFRSLSLLPLSARLRLYLHLHLSATSAHQDSQLVSAIILELGSHAWQSGAESLCQSLQRIATASQRLVSGLQRQVGQVDVDR